MAGGVAPFAAVDRGRLVRDPYPHLVVEDALAPDLAATLLQEMPPLEVFTRGADAGSNLRFALASAHALADSRVASRWKEAQRACLGGLEDLLQRFVRRFADDIGGAYADFRRRFGDPAALRAVERGRPGRAPHEVGMEAQMVVNTPARVGGTRVRGAHVDQPDKLISALLYLRAPEDDSTGAELELYTATNPALTFDAVNETPLDNVRPVVRYPYRHNLLILPLNTPRSLHGVTPRSATPRPRYHLHLVGEMVEPLFSLPRTAAR
jgi:hypothetical protein